ncbi:hypothetical protein BDAP_002566 [Binucleata daphniae]
MNLWIKENIASMPQPFLERNIAKKKETFCDIYEQKQCSLVCFDTLMIQNSVQHDFSDVLAISYFKNDNYTLQPQKIYRKVTKVDNKSNNELVLNPKVVLRNKTCFDELKIILILHNNTEFCYYTADINLCYQLRQNGDKSGVLNLNLLETYQISTKNIKLDIAYTIYSLKSNNKLHYCFSGINQEIKDKYKCVFGTKEYKIDKYSCMLCYKEFFRLENLNDHINCNHFYYKSRIDNNCDLVIDAKEKHELDDNYLTGYIVRKNSSLMIHSLQNSNTEYKKTTLLFVNEQYKRRLTRNKVSMKKKIYKDEIMENTEATKISTDWLDMLIENEFKKIHNIKEDDKEMMQKWNLYMQKENGKETNFVKLVTKYMLNDTNNKSHIKLLIIFYNKALLSQNEIIDLLKETLAIKI